MPKVLSAGQLTQYQRDGFCGPIRIFEPSVARTLRANLEAFEATNGGPLTGSQRFKSHLLFKWLADLVRAPDILDVVEDIIGPDILCWTTNWWVKEPHSPSFVSWHQDSHYWGLDTDGLVTVWVAFSPATVESGCMRLLPGSHLGERLAHRDTFNDDNMLTRGQQIVEGIDESRAVNMEVDTGEAAIFTYRIAHASYPNESADRRIGFAIRYIAPSTRQTLAEWDSAALVRGTDPYGHFALEPTPQRDFDPAAVAFHRRADEAQRAIYFKGTDWQEHRT